MESDSASPLMNAKWCTCGCHYDKELGTASWPRSVKRKFAQISNDNRVTEDRLSPSIARVGLENECTVLRETLRNREQCIQSLYAELDEERNASASAANEAMSMILRLQREKAEVQLEARQFKRFAEEKMSHDQEEMLALEDLLYKREQIIQALNCEVQAYKHRLLSLGFEEAEAVSVAGNILNGTKNLREANNTEYDCSSYYYPPLKCNLNETPISVDDNDAQFDIEKYAFGETPKGRDKLQNLENHVNPLERNASSNQMEGDFSSTKDFLEKVVVGQSPKRSRHARRFSQDSFSSLYGLVREPGKDSTVGTPRQRSGLNRMDGSMKMDDYPYPRKADNASDFGEDMSDRIYTIDSVQAIPYSRNETYEFPQYNVGVADEFVTTPKDVSARVYTDEPEIQKLCLRLQALEADRESMRQTIMSMSTEKAQLILLKEIAQQLCKEMVPEKRMPVKRSPAVGGFSLMSVAKWIVSFIFWRKKAHGSKYNFGLSKSNVGLLLLLERPPSLKLWRILSRSYKA